MGQLAYGLEVVKRFALDDSDTSRVISAVFQLLEAIQ
jgi:hypothetical protein